MNSRRRGRDLLAEVIGPYLQVLTKVVNEIEEVVALGNAKALQDSAHGLKSCSANVEATDLAELCRELKKFGGKRRIHHASSMLEEIISQHQRVCEKIRFGC